MADEKFEGCVTLRFSDKWTVHYSSENLKSLQIYLEHETIKIGKVKVPRSFQSSGAQSNMGCSNKDIREFFSGVGFWNIDYEVG